MGRGGTSGGRVSIARATAAGVIEARSPSGAHVGFQTIPGGRIYSTRLAAYRQARYSEKSRAKEAARQAKETARIAAGKPRSEADRGIQRGKGGRGRRGPVERAPLTEIKSVTVTRGGRTSHVTDRGSLKALSTLGFIDRGPTRSGSEITEITLH